MSPFRAPTALSWASATDRSCSVLDATASASPSAVVEEFSNVSRYASYVDQTLSAAMGSTASQRRAAI